MDIECVAKAIFYLRKRAGYTQKDLADRLGVSDKAISKWERGLGLPDVSLLGKLSVLLDTDTDSLLKGDVIHHDKKWHGICIFDDNLYEIGPDTIVFDKPLLYYLLSYFLLVGIKDIRIICADKNKEFIKHEFGGEKALNISISFGDTLLDVITDESFMNCDNVMILFGRSFIYGVDLTRFFQKAMNNKEHITILALPKGNRNDSSIIRFDENKKIVTSSHDSQIKTQYDYYNIPILFCPKPLLYNIYRAAVNSNDISKIFYNQDVYVEVLDRGFVEISINTNDDVIEASNFVRIVQDHCGMIIYCIEEVAWRRGLIQKSNMIYRGKIKEGTEYGDYILAFCSET